MNTRHDIEACPSEFGLERLRLGELEGMEAGRATALHVAGCAACTARIVQMSGAAPQFPLDAVWEAVHGGQSPQGTTPLSSPFERAGLRGIRGRLAMAFAVTAAAAVVGTVVLLRPAPPVDLVKGGPWGLVVIAKVGGRQEVARLSSGARLSPGDRLRFEVSTTWTRGYVAIISLDSAGVVSSLVPSEGQTVEIQGGRRVLLDGAVELDQTAGPERIDLLGCPRPLLVANLASAARQALRREGGDLRRVHQIAPDCTQETFWIEKVNP